MDLPCSRCFLWLHAGGTEPREHLKPLALSRPAIPPSPLSDRVGYSDHVRFRGYIPVHFIPAYNLPVYASQRPLPDATQDSVRGCLLGFTAAVIADGRLQRACKAQRSSNQDMQISRIRLSDKTSRLHPRHVVPKPAQAYEPEVPVEVREWISPALASPDLVLEDPRCRGAWYHSVFNWRLTDRVNSLQCSAALQG